MSLIILKISGMTCINCKTRIENALAVLEGIKKADVSWKKGRGEIEYDEEKISLNEIQKIIKSLDYKVENSGDGKKKKSLSRLQINICNLITAHEPVKTCSEAECFHNKPPAMRVVGKSL